MQNPSIQGIAILIFGVIFLFLIFVSFIVTIVHQYKQKQFVHIKHIESLRSLHENALLKSQLEIQEQTFQNISREIHDSIGQKLTLAKLHLNTLNLKDEVAVQEKVTNSVNMIGEAINDLTDISRSMSSELILNNGLIKALEFEVDQLKKSGIYTIEMGISGEPVFMEASTELLLFRIAQEAINNIIKHSQANLIALRLHYTETMLRMEITDNGCGFSADSKRNGTGLTNIKKRAALLKGSVDIVSAPGGGTQLKISIPLNQSNANA